STVERYEPAIVFHLAAQPLVRRSYAEPRETFNTSVMGTVNLLEACRSSPSVVGIVVVTSDKAYENREQATAYTESDPLGGRDPYSASKACAELAALSYARSVLPGGHQILLATARAGNVIGGGDWGEDRLLPDLMRAAATGREVRIRAPDA